MIASDPRELLPPPWRSIAPRQRLRITRLAAGEFVFRQGQRARGAFFLVKGRVALVRSLADGTQVTLFAATTGDTFAEASLFSIAYHCDAIAKEPAVVIEMPKRDVGARIRNDPSAGWELARTLAAQVRDLRASLELRNVKSAHERVLAWLRLNAVGDPPVTQAAPSWMAVASEIGLTHEAVYRALARLEAAGSIRRDGRTAHLIGGH